MLSASALCTLEQSKEYLDVSDNDKDELLELTIEAASRIIREYVGYNPISSIYTDELYSGGSATRLNLKAIPITTLTDVKESDTSVGATQIAAFNLMDKYIEDENYVFARGLHNYKISYTAGYDREEDEGLSALSVFALTTCRIAGLFYKEHGKTGILATTSLSFDTGARTFFDFTLDKYLAELDIFKPEVTW